MMVLIQYLPSDPDSSTEAASTSALCPQWREDGTSQRLQHPGTSPPDGIVNA